MNATQTYLNIAPTADGLLEMRPPEFPRLPFAAQSTTTL